MRIDKLLPFILALLLTFCMLSCDGGLAPKPEAEKSYLSGTLRFVKGIADWPPEDSVFAVRVVAFKKYPDSTGIFADILEGNAYFTLASLPLFVDSSRFSFEITDTPTDLVYIAAIQQFDTLITAQRVIGLYNISDEKHKPSTIRIESGRHYDISIDIDFKDLPPMPF
ncbi:MAG: hypothetical protein M9949_04540 [Candidatus Kapabacteria bacterium]|nr:hypothetical protein [Candidatus Kapabacteria bacterium]